MTNKWTRYAVVAAIGFAALLLVWVLSTLPPNDSITRSVAPLRSDNDITGVLSGTATTIPVSTVTSGPLGPWITEHEAVDLVMTYVSETDLVVYEWAARRVNEVELVQFTRVSPPTPDPSQEFWIVVLKVPADSLEHEDITFGVAPAMPTNTPDPGIGTGTPTQTPVLFSGNMNIEPDSALVDENGLAGLYYVLKAEDGLLKSRGLINPLYFTYEDIEALAPEPTVTPALIIP